MPTPDPGPVITSRHMDEDVAASAVTRWMDIQIDKAYQRGGNKVGLEITEDVLPKGGGVRTLWQNHRPVAFGVIFRDDANYSVMVGVEVPGAEETSRPGASGIPLNSSGDRPARSPPRS